MMAVPIASVNKDDLAEAFEYEIGLSRQRAVVKLVPEAKSVECRSDYHFRLGIAATDTRH